MRAAVTGDDTGEATDWIAVNWVVDGAITDILIVHFANNGFEGGDILRWITVEFDIGNVTSITEVVIGTFYFNFFKSRDGIINRYVERIGVKIAVGDAFDDAELFAVNLGKATGDTLCWSSEEGEVEFVLLAELITFFAHMSNDIETKLAGIFVFAVMLAGHSDESFGETDKADTQSAVFDDVS